MSNKLKCIASLGLIVAWAGMIAWALINGAKIEKVQDAVGSGLVVFLVFSSLQPDFGKFQPFVRWSTLVVYVVLISSQLYWATPSERIIYAKVFACLLGVAGLVSLVNTARARWQKMRSPLTKIVVVTAFLTTAARVSLIAVGYMVLTLDWLFVARNWEVTLLIVFLPLLLAGWWALTKWQARKS